MKSTIINLLLLLLVFVISACDALTGEEIARMTFTEISKANQLQIQDTTLTLAAGEKVNLWTEMNLEYEGDLGMRYQLMIIRETDTLNIIELDPFERDITMGESKVQLGQNTKWKFSGRMNFLEIEQDGDYKFQSILLASDNPSLQLKKAALVFKK